MGEGAGADDARQAEVQTLLFSATVHPWIKEVTTKYFKKETTVNVDLVSGPPATPPRAARSCVRGIWHSCTRHLAALPSVRPLASRLL